MLAVLEWLGVLIFILFAIIRLFTKNSDEEPSRPLPTNRQPPRPPPPPGPAPQEQAPTPEQQIRNFLQDLQKRMAEQQQQQPVSTPVPPTPPPYQRPRWKPPTEVVEVAVEEVEVEKIAEAFPEEAPHHHFAPAYDFDVVAPVHARLNLTFDRESIRRAFVMREILGAPRALAPYEREA